MSIPDRGPMQPSPKDIGVKPLTGDPLLPKIDSPRSFAKLDLSQATAFVTGGNRDVGRAITQALLTQNTRVGSVCLRESSLRKSKLQVDAARTGGHELRFTQADLTTTEGLQAITDSWQEQFGHEPDILVLSTSGATQEVNVTANNALAKKCLKLRRGRIENGETISQGHIVLMQSEPGHFYDILQGVAELPKFYDQVAPAKLEGEQTLSRLKEECTELGVQFSIVVPPEVSDTGNMALFKRIDKDASRKSRALSAQLGTEQAVLSIDVGKMVVGVLKRDDLEQGHVELTNGVIDAGRMLSKLYGPNAIFVHTLKLKGQNAEGQETGEGRTIVNARIWEQTKTNEVEPNLVVTQGSETIHSSAVLRKDMTAKDAEGHFRPEIGISIVPGYKSLAAATEAATYADGRPAFSLILQGYERLSFGRPVFPGDRVEATARKRTTEDTSPMDATVFIKKPDHQIAAIQAAEVQGIQLQEKDPSAQYVLEPPQLIELAAQALGVLALSDKLTKDVPLFLGTGKTSFEQAEIRPGDTMKTVATVTDHDKKATKGNVVISRLRVYHDEDDSQINGEGPFQRVDVEHVATLEGLTFRMLPEKTAKRILNSAAHSLP